MSISTYCNKHCLPKPSIEEQHSVAMATANVHEQLTGATEYIAELSHRPVAGGGEGGAQAPPEIFRLELIFAIKVEFWY